MSFLALNGSNSLWFKKYTSDAAYFTVKADVTVYVGLDSRVVNVPSWLGNWTKTNLSITDDGNPSVTYILYKKDFSSNSVVTLGPNGASSNAVNYIVIIKSEQSSIIYGDLNGDGFVDSLDLTILKRFILRKINLPQDKLEAADLNRDGSVDSIDNSILKRYILRKIKQLPL